MKNGVPYDIAMTLDDITRAAMCVIFHELDGAEFDDSRMQFRDPPK